MCNRFPIKEGSIVITLDRYLDVDGAVYIAKGVCSDDNLWYGLYVSAVKILLAVLNHTIHSKITSSGFMVGNLKRFNRKVYMKHIVVSPGITWHDKWNSPVSMHMYAVMDGLVKDSDVYRDLYKFGVLFRQDVDVKLIVGDTIKDTYLIISPLK